MKSLFKILTVLFVILFLSATTFSQPIGGGPVRGESVVSTLNSMMVTELGGLAIKLINKTGATSVKGSIVEPDDTVDSAFSLVDVGGADPIGIVYGDDDGLQVADGAECWIVISGIAQVLFIGATTRHHFARVCVAGDTDDAAGSAISEAVPTSPFATDKHFQEIGHVIESIGAPGLAKCVIHFN